MEAAAAVKRCIDVVGALVGLALVGLPLLVVIVLIRLTSPGPALFRQPRAGLHGSVFTCLKLRTMVDGADSQRAELRELHGGGGATFKIRDDPRTTAVGAWLRRFSIDELPQLVNVLTGSMSLVGPRPHPLDDVAMYDDLARRRLTVKPGLTGIWQVSGRSDAAWEDNLVYDLLYVDTWSLGLDIRLLLRTPLAVVRGRGAY